MSRVRPHVTYANVMVTLLAFVVLGGGAYAITVAKKNSVVSKSIKNGQVKKADLAKNSVNGAKVADNSLSGADINEAGLAQVPSAASADHATTADHANGADTATNADHATSADHANSADTATNADHATSADTSTTAANGAHKIAYDDPATDTAPVPILSLGGMTLNAFCFNSAFAGLTLNVASTGDADLNVGFLQQREGATPTPVVDGTTIAANSSADVLDFSVLGGNDFERGEGQFVYHNASRVITVTFHAVINTHTNRCQVTGTAVQAAG